jgi:6-phosphogluconolactonase (cycloisomerase 2 family)/predicted secreted Zn-dependent protease
VVALECSIDAYNEQGATVSDDCDPNVTVVVGGDTVDSMTNGVYTVTYDAVDATGNVAVQLTRTVTVGDATAPVISLAGAPPVGGGGAAGELTFIATYKNGQNGISGLDGAEKPIVSPDGKNVYAIALKGDSNNTGFLLAFSRDEVTGELTYLETESGHPGINGPKHVIVSPNGKWVYICTLKDQSVLTFSRDATDGRLTYLDTIDVGRNMTYIDTTPDGENLYAVSSRHVERLTIDTVTGIPTWIERVQPPSSSAGDKLTVSDDGKFLYWGDINANRVYVFSIDVSTGGLTHLQTFNNGDSGSLINGVTDLKISPDGLFLYIAATRDDYLTVFSRDITTGLITFASDIASPNGAVRSLAISPDGATLIAADQSNSIRSYARDFTTGALTLIEEERDGVNGVDGLDRSLGVDISPDGSHVYVTARDDDAVTFFELEPPVIAVGEAFVTLECSVDSYTEYGANVTDACDPNVVVVIGGVVVDATVPGVYVVTYDATDSSGNVATQVSRTVTVQDTTAPVITLNGDGSQVIECPSPYVELGAIAADDCDQGLGLVVIDASEVDATTPGSYVVTYNISDASGNPAITVTRSVEVIDTTPPVISLLGDNPQVVEGSSSYIELGATASDTCDQALGPVVIDASSVNTAVPGFYSVTYDVSDANGNAAITVVRSVEVTDTTPPEITLLGVNPQLIECPGVYVELGATASDSHDQSLGAVLIDSSAVNIAVPGIYPVTYNISDASGNAASQVTRTVIVQDTTSPEISLVGTDPQLIECSSPYTELGATASDACDQALGAVVIDASGVDTTTPGDYVVTYNISDASGNAATQLTRTVTVRDTTPPVIVLLGDNPQLIECPSPYLELGATASDTCDLALGAVVIDASAVDTTTPGDYVVTYNIGDASGNAAVQLTRTVTVRDTTPPVVVLLGDNPQLIECPSPYVELGATASDTCDLALGAVVIDASAVDTTTPGDYVVTYNVSDASGNVATQLTRTVTVRDTTPPVIVLLGDNPQLIECPSPYVELSATASDTCDQALGAVVVDASAVDTTTPGDYVVTYNISDASGNTATQMTRTVRVQDTTPPVITLTGLAALTLECNVDTYGEEGATVSDTCDTTVTVIVGGDTVDPTHVGIYVVTYDSTDVSGNAAVQLTRTVSVVDTTAPVITLLGYNPETIECPDPYQEEGATASDLCDGDLTAEIVIDSSEVNSTVPGIYEVSYTAEDAAGNSTTEIREVEVVDTTVPVISLAGDASVVLLQGDIYVEEGGNRSQGGKQGRRGNL